MNGYGIVLAFATAVLSGLVGTFALMKKMALAGDVVSHLALPGLGLAFLWHFDPLLGAAGTLAIGIALIDRLQRRTGFATDAAIGVIFVAGLALGTLLTPREDLIDALFGGFEPLSMVRFVAGIAGCAIVAAALFLMRDRLILIIFSPDVATSLGIGVARVNFLFLCAFGLTVLLGLQYLGALLVGAMIIVPAAIGRRIGRTLDQCLLISAAAGFAAVAIGIAAAARWHLAQGPAIVGAVTLLFAFSLVYREKTP